MSLEAEIIMQQIYKHIEDYHKYSNTNYHFNNFAKLIEKNDNKLIEESEVYQLLISMLSNSKTRFKEKLNINTPLYRARIVDIGRIEKFSTNGNTLNGLNKYESKEPPLHVSSDGRSNIAGASYLYVATDKYTAVSECKPLRSSFLSVATFNNLKELNIFNLCDNDSTDELNHFHDKNAYIVNYLVALVMQSFYNSVYDIENGYKVSQYIAELVRKHGYDGIAYKSFISNGKNYAIFNCCESNIAFKESEIVQILAQHIDIVSLNDGETIINPNNFKMISKESTLKFKQYMIDTINYLNIKEG